MWCGAILSGDVVEGKIPALNGRRAGVAVTGAGRRPLWIDFVDIEPASVSISNLLLEDVYVGRHPVSLPGSGDKKVLIGGTALELGDGIRRLPNGRIVSGALVQALAAETVLQDRLLRSTSLTIARLTRPGLLWSF